jgi:antitoxin component YwqK of YwqJK toxin-antitoxin module
MRYLLLLLLFSLKVLAQQDTIATFSGIKKIYHKNGQLKKSMTYKNGVVNGSRISYFENGKISEEGTWLNRHWIKGYTLYYENGCLQQRLFYGEDGKRKGLQRYYFPNGSLQAILNMADGKEEGYALLFNENGSLEKKPVYYVNGVKTDINNPEMLRMLLDIAERENATVTGMVK